jgi:hypothetical protein
MVGGGETRPFNTEKKEIRAEALDYNKIISG